MLGDSAVLTVLGQVSFMPVLVLAARLCPEVCPWAAPYFNITLLGAMHRDIIRSPASALNPPA